MEGTVAHTGTRVCFLEARTADHTCHILAPEMPAWGWLSSVFVGPLLHHVTCLEVHVISSWLTKLCLFDAAALAINTPSLCTRHNSACDSTQYDPKRLSHCAAPEMKLCGSSRACSMLHVCSVSQMPHSWFPLAAAVKGAQGSRSRKRKRRMWRRRRRRRRRRRACRWLR